MIAARRGQVAGLALCILAGACARAPAPPSDAFFALRPHNPVVEANGLALYVKRAGNATPAITGDFTGWEPQPAQRIDQTDWFVYRTTLPQDARVEYLVALGGGDIRVDERNPHRVASVGGQASEIRMPGFAEQTETLSTGPAMAGSLQEVPSTNAALHQRVVIYRPPSHRTPEAIVYFHDGSMMIDNGVPVILDRLIAGDRIVPIIAVFVDPLSRVDAYKAEPAFRQWFAGELVPHVERLIGRQAPPTRAIIGVSRGAIAAIDLSWHEPALFPRCGLLIPSTTPTDLTRVIASAPPRPIRFATIAGQYDAKWLAEARALRDALGARYEHAYREVPEGHNVQTWRGHIDDVLSALGFARPEQ